MMKAIGLCGALAVLIGGAVSASEIKMIDQYSLSPTGQTFPEMIRCTDDGLVLVTGLAEDVTAKQKYWITRRSTDFGNTWETVDQYQLEKDKGAIGRSIAIAPDGRIFIEGNAAGQSIVRESMDRGKTWHTIAQYADPLGSSFAHEGTFNANGDYVVGLTGIDPANNLHRNWSSWVMSHQTNSWSIANTFSDPGYDRLFFIGINFDRPTGSLYGVGGYVDSSQAFHWFVRKSLDNGSSWKTIDDIQHGEAFKTFTAKDGTVFVTGELGDGDDFQDTWMVRQSSDGGENWVTTDKLNKGFAWEGFEDSAGDIFVGGAINMNPMIRVSHDRGASWDEFHKIAAPGGAGFNRGGCADSKGHSYFVHNVQMSAKETDTQWWVERYTR